MGQYIVHAWNVPLFLLFLKLLQLETCILNLDETNHITWSTWLLISLKVTFLASPGEFCDGPWNLLEFVTSHCLPWLLLVISPSNSTLYDSSGCKRVLNSLRVGKLLTYESLYAVPLPMKCNMSDYIYIAVLYMNYLLCIGCTEVTGFTFDVMFPRK